MISEVRTEDIRDAGKSGPQVDKTRNAQRAVDEFLESGMDACSVDWRGIDPDFDQAKRAVAYRISHTKYDRHDDADALDLSMRSSREKGEIYLIHSSRVEG